MTIYATAPFHSKFVKWIRLRGVLQTAIFNWAVRRLSGHLPSFSALAFETQIALERRDRILMKKIAVQALSSYVMDVAHLS